MWLFNGRNKEAADEKGKTEKRSCCESMGLNEEKLVSVNKSIWDSSFWWNLLCLNKETKTVSEQLSVENSQRKNEISRHG